MAGPGRPRKIQESKMDDELKNDDMEKEAKKAKHDDWLPRKDLFRFDEVARYFGVDEATIKLWAEHRHFTVEQHNRTKWITRPSILRFRLKSRVII